jgi:hypothetical protein
MNRLKKIFILLIILFGTVSCNIRLFNKSHRSEKTFSGPSGNGRSSGAAARTIKKQEAKDKANKKAYARAVKNSRKRTIEIQTPGVQARMKQNKADIATRQKSKNKNARISTKKAGKKYK